jgi:hypothetical protein
MATRLRPTRTPRDDPDELDFKDVADIVKPRSYVFYGRSGSGKTTLSSTFPKPLLLLDVRDEGTDSIADVEDVKVLEINEWEDIERAYWWIKRHPKAFKTVVMDTVTQLQQAAVLHVLKGKKKDTSRAGDWGTMSKREWGDVAQLMKTWVVNFRDLPVEMVFLAQDRMFNFDEDEGSADEQLSPEIGPRLSPSVASALNAAVGVIGNTYTRSRAYKKEINGKKVEREKIEYCLRIGPSPLYVTKIRKPRGITAPAFIVDPTYDDIISAIKGE